MEETYCTKTIILNRTDFREYDSRTTVYSLDKGKLELVARGVKKIKSKLAAHLEPFNLAEIMVVRGRKFDYIGAAASRKCFPNIKGDLEKLAAAGKAVNVFNKLVKAEEADKGTFSLLEEFLGSLDSRELKIGHDLWAGFFTLKLMAQLGYKPELYNCVACNKKITSGENLFDLSRGGLMGGECLNKKGNGALVISDNGVKLLRAIIDNNFTKLKNFKISVKLEEEVKTIISSFCQYHI
ncbi:MAG: DNA repair protein RecO [Patescibacteria group bacterium]|nr:DNA repair protein RecO [Patescibacteria group bacterium]MDD5554925.1 DNA repair protein RecO [Patescibacteria group bacterium]